jgi:hypothetical protein
VQLCYIRGQRALLHKGPTPIGASVGRGGRSIRARGGLLHDYGLWFCVWLLVSLFLKLVGGALVRGIDGVTPHLPCEGLLRETLDLVFRLATMVLSYARFHVPSSG